MKTKIQIKSIFGKVLFEYEKEKNTIKDTLINAVLKGSDLMGADLRGANIMGANLTRANLTGAYLMEANLTRANLTGANLTGANLTGANLTGAYLTGAYLRGEDGEIIKIQKAAFFLGLYHYDAASIIDQDGVKWIKLGCFTRKLKDWKKDFWNNNQEFPNDNSKKSKLRKFAFQTCKNWFNTVKQ